MSVIPSFSLKRYKMILGWQESRDRFLTSLIQSSKFKQRSKTEMKASWKGKQIAQSEHTVVVEGNHYFPPESVDMSLLVPSDTQTRCSWKGVASYYTIQADEQSNVDACWYYPEPKEAASQIKGHLAFWRGVEVSS